MPQTAIKRYGHAPEVITAAHVTKLLKQLNPIVEADRVWSKT